ncbi:hypothetical protein B2G69_06520 [Methylorubrum zatmanii]|nr:hypothetical protein B2G69_06520 [Methylorubrum zatmanii]
MGNRGDSVTFEDVYDLIAAELCGTARAVRMGAGPHAALFDELVCLFELLLNQRCWLGFSEKILLDRCPRTAVVLSNC